MVGLNGVIILAGGKSERMVFPKPYLLFEGQTFLNKIVEEYYSAGITSIYVVLNDNFCKGEWEKYIFQVKSHAEIIKNPNPELGRFHSLKLGIEKMLDFEYCFIQNIDNPFVNKALINSLMDNVNPEGYTSPVFMGKFGHPVIISKNIIQHLNNLPDGDVNLKNILSGFPRLGVQVNNDNILININTAEDYERCINSPQISKKKRIANNNN